MDEPRSSNQEPHGLLSNTEKDNIEQQVVSLCLRCWHDDVQRLRAILAAKAWIGFDLNDTLHKFRRSSGTATNKVPESLRTIRYPHTCVERCVLPSPPHKDSERLLRRKDIIHPITADKDSPRFCPTSPCHRRTTSNSYPTCSPPTKSPSQTSPEPKSGALPLLLTLKRKAPRAKKQHPPHNRRSHKNAQERTIRRLGVERHIDFRATSNHFREFKTGRLFPPRPSTSRSFPP